MTEQPSITSPALRHRRALAEALMISPTILFAEAA